MYFLLFAFLITVTCADAFSEGVPWPRDESELQKSFNLEKATTEPPKVVVQDNKTDLICTSSCMYLMNNGYFMDPDAASITELCTATIAKHSSQCASKALGIENGEIPDSSITASSYSKKIYRPEYGRLNFKGNGKAIAPAWAPSKAKSGEWIQVDLGQEMKVTAIATQGNGKSTIEEWTKTYSLYYSSDGQSFEDYDDGREFPGNNNRNGVVKNRIDPPIIARFIRVVPKAWNFYNALRLELCGCSLGVFGSLRSGASTCVERPLGMESGAIPDSSITASSYYHARNYPHEARLNNKFKNLLASGVWSVHHDKHGSWIQVDLGKIGIVSGIATQGGSGHVKSYKLAYSNDGEVFTDYLNGKVLNGNNDRDTAVKRELIPVIKARYVRLYPQTWYDHVALRFELYGCKQDFSKDQEKENIEISSPDPEDVSIIDS